MKVQIEPERPDSRSDRPLCWHPDELAITARSQALQNVVMADEDADLIALLSAVDADGWAELDALIASWPEQAAFFEWRGGERDPAGVIQMPWVEYGQTVNSAVDWLYQQRLITSLFDWTTWYRPDRYPDASSIELGPTVDAIRLATSIIRGDRFSEGAIASAVEDGTLIAVLRRLQRWQQDRTQRTDPGI